MGPGFESLEVHQILNVKSYDLTFFLYVEKMLGEQGSRQLSAFVCIHQPDGFKDLLTRDFCGYRLFILLDLGCCRGQILGIEVGFDFLGQLQPGFVETLLVHTETLAKRERVGLLGIRKTVFEK